MALNSSREVISPPTTLVAVRPNKGSQETWWVGGSILLIILTSVFLLRHTVFSASSTDRDLSPSYALQATDLTEKQKSLLMELNLASQELRFFHHSEHHWPTVQWLTEEGIAPFVHDSSWHYLGEHQWQQVEQGYLGLALDASQVGHVLLFYPQGADGDAEVWFFTQPIIGELSDWLALAYPAWIQAGWKRWSLSASLSHE